MEDIALLKRIEFFKDLTTGELMQINKITERSAFRKGEVVVKEGTPCEAFFVVKTGITYVEKDGKVIAELGEGESIGEISFIDKGLRSATVLAKEDTVLIKIPSDSFHNLLSREKDIAGKAYKELALILCRRLRESNEAIRK